jgi:hypothetical protein
VWPGERQVTSTRQVDDCAQCRTAMPTPLAPAGNPSARGAGLPRTRRHPRIGLPSRPGGPVRSCRVAHPVHLLVRSGTSRPGRSRRARRPRFNMRADGVGPETLVRHMACP